FRSGKVVDGRRRGRRRYACGAVRVEDPGDRGVHVVARRHLLVLWSRLGIYDQQELDNLLWKERHG
ncbi:hypothetical protein, partial [Streptomyces griseus]|uniref:hypothetical protein n=1 Tax=Streptomyces griseus TaxID=1911 RepID=UPI0033FFFBA9